MNEIIHYSMTKEYVPDWTTKDAIREIYQNFEDYCEYDVKKCDDFDKANNNDYVEIMFRNGYNPSNHNFMSLGFSPKRNNKNAIGGHGEGLKVASLVLLRNDIRVKILTKSYCYEPFFNHKTIFDNATLCFEVTDKDRLSEDNKYNFYVIIYGKKKDLIELLPESNDEILLNDDVDKVNTLYGDRLIDSSYKGKIYVGGLYVQDVESLKYGYNFDPSFVSIGRDRKAVSVFDLEYYASCINSLLDSNKDIIKNKAINNPEYRYCSVDYNNIKLKDLKINIKSQNDVEIKAYGTNLTKQMKADLIGKNKSVRNKIIKQKLSLQKKRKPENILKEYYDNHKHSMNSSQKLDFEALMKQSKNWK